VNIVRFTMRNLHLDARRVDGRGKPRVSLDIEIEIHFQYGSDAFLNASGIHHYAA